MTTRRDGGGDGGDGPRDAHLLAALRHAPDRELVPPAELSARILGQARQAVRAGPGTAPSAAAPAGFLAVVSRWFDGLSRPLAAGALGSVLVAGLVGLMWREGPPTQALPGSDPVVTAAADPPPLLPAPAMPAPAVDPAVDGRVPAVGAPTRAPAAPQAVAPPTPIAAPAPARPAPAAPGRDAALSQRAEVATATKSTESANAAGAGPASPQLAPPAQASPRARAMATAPAAPTLPAAPQVAAAAAPDAAAPAAAADRARVPEAPRAATVAPDPLRLAIAALSATDDREWQPRLTQFQARARGRWSRSASAAPEGGSLVTDARGQALGRLWVDGLQLHWQDLEGQLWQATLTPPDTTTLPPR
jgi:hypothetical protein